jgi:hypothetical protein
MEHRGLEKPRDLMVGDIIYYPLNKIAYHGFITEIAEYENRVSVYWFHEYPPFSEDIYLDGYNFSWFKIR